jgi:hypothetical protein
MNCDWLQDRFDIVGIDSFSKHDGESVSCECLRPAGHVGPHLIKRVDRIGGYYVLWQQDLCPLGTCSDCDGEDPTDYCLAYGKVSAEVAVRYITDAEFEG